MPGNRKRGFRWSWLWLLAVAVVLVYQIVQWQWLGNVGEAKFDAGLDGSTRPQPTTDSGPDDEMTWIYVNPSEGSALLGVEYAAAVTVREIRKAWGMRPPATHFAVMQRPVSVDKYASWLRAVGRTDDADKLASDVTLAGAAAIHGVSWSDAVSYCASSRAALPTEAQWIWATQTRAAILFSNDAVEWTMDIYQPDFPWGGSARTRTQPAVPLGTGHVVRGFILEGEHQTQHGFLLKNERDLPYRGIGCQRCNAGTSLRLSTTDASRAAILAAVVEAESAFQQCSVGQQPFRIEFAARATCRDGGSACRYDDGTVVPVDDCERVSREYDICRIRRRPGVNISSANDKRLESTMADCLATAVIAHLKPLKLNRDWTGVVQLDEDRIVEPDSVTFRCVRSIPAVP